MPARRMVIAQFIIWSAYAGIRFWAAIPAIPPEARGVMALADVVQASTGLLVTTALWFAITRWVNPSTFGGWSAAALGTVSASFAWMVLDRALLVTIASIASVRIPWELFMHGVDLTYLLTTGAWTTGVVALMLTQKEARLREALLVQISSTHEAQTRAMSARLNPHFLFNSLNTIRSFVAEDPERGREMLTRLSNFLRHALSVDPAAATTLAAEVEALRAYLWIEEARFEPALQVEIDIEDNARTALVPPLLLQPLVENAVRHGDPAADGIHRIRITANTSGAGLRIEIHNTGSLHTRARAGGIGIELSRTRLAQMYGTSSKLTLDQRGEWVVLTLEVDEARFANRKEGR